MNNKLASIFVKALQFALVADQAFEATQAPGASAATLLQPGNFNALLTEIAAIAAPPAPPVA